MSKMSKAIAVLGVVAGLGVAALPLSSYAANTSTATADVQVKVGGAISMTVDNGAGSGAKNLVDFGDVKLNNAPVAKGLKVTVSTNEAAGDDGQGYSLSMTTTTANNALVNDNHIELPAGVPTQDKSAWGYAVGTAANQNFTDLTGWAAVPSLGSTAAVINANGSIAAGETASDNYVYFGVSTSGTQAEGTYKGSVIFTATAN